MKLLFFFSVCTMLTASVFANRPHEEEWRSETFELGNFTEIYLEGGYQVFLAQGDENKVTVKVLDDDIFDDLRIKTDNNKLRIRVERDCFNYGRVKLYITFKTLAKVNIEGGVKLKTKGYLNLNNLEMYVSGGAKIEFDMKADNVTIFGEGGILFEFGGVAKSLDIKISGAGHIDAEGLRAENVSVKIEGVGSGTVYATETLYAEINGIGKINYRGDPKVTSNIDGIGLVKRN